MNAKLLGRRGVSDRAEAAGLARACASAAAAIYLLKLDVDHV
jgi:hypothetical protein